MRKIEREYSKLCLAEGFALSDIINSGNHLKLVGDRGYIVASSTPSDRRNFLSVRAQIRRAVQFL